MKQQWETERHAAAHRDRISHRNPIIISDCNLRTLYQSGNSHKLSMTTQDLLHYASTETANMDEKEKILQPAQHPYIRQHQVSRHSSCWRTVQHKTRPRQSHRSFKSSGSLPTKRHHQQQRRETFSFNLATNLRHAQSRFPRPRTRQSTWGPFLESPGNFTGPKSNIQNEI